MINIQTNPQITDLAAQILAMQNDVTNLVNAAAAGVVSVQRGYSILTLANSLGFVVITLPTPIVLGKSFVIGYMSPNSTVQTYDACLDFEYELISSTQLRIKVSTVSYNIIVPDVSCCWEVISYA